MKVESSSSAGLRGRPRALISYAHEPGSTALEDLVRQLWGFLREQGIDVRIDLAAAGQRQDWSLWMADQIREADYILVVASPAYRSRAEGRSGPGTGRGVQWESRLIRNAFYNDQTVLNRFVPVVLPGQTPAGLPDFLGPNISTVFHVREFTVAGAEALLRHLTSQPAEIPPPLGSLVILPPNSPPTATASSGSSARGTGDDHEHAQPDSTPDTDTQAASGPPVAGHIRPVIRFGWLGLWIGVVLLLGSGAAAAATLWFGLSPIGSPDARLRLGYAGLTLLLGVGLGFVRHRRRRGGDQRGRSPVSIATQLAALTTGLVAIVLTIAFVDPASVVDTATTRGGQPFTDKRPRTSVMSSTSTVPTRSNPVPPPVTVVQRSTPLTTTTTITSPPSSAPTVPDMAGNLSILFSNYSNAPTTSQTWATTLTTQPPGTCPTSDPCYRGTMWYGVNNQKQSANNFIVSPVVRNGAIVKLNATDEGIPPNNLQTYTVYPTGNGTFSGSWERQGQSGNNTTADVVFTECTVYPDASGCELVRP